MRLLILCCFFCAFCAFGGACRFALPKIGPSVTANLLPDTVFATRSGTDVQLPGTQLFLGLPSGYSIDSVRDTIRGLKGSVIGYQYFAGSAIREVLPDYERTIDSVLHKHYYAKQRFQMGSYTALLYYFVSNRPHKEALSLIFGDAQFTAVCVGVIPSKDTANRAEVLNTMVSIYRDEDVATNEAPPFTLDLGQSGFARVNRVGVSYVYTLGGVTQSSLGDPVDAVCRHMVTGDPFSPFRNSIRASFGDHRPGFALRKPSTARIQTEVAYRGYGDAPRHGCP